MNTTDEGPLKTCPQCGSKSTRKYGFNGYARMDGTTNRKPRRICLNLECGRTYTIDRLTHPEHRIWSARLARVKKNVPKLYFHCEGKFSKRRIAKFFRISERSVRNYIKAAEDARAKKAASNAQ